MSIAAIATALIALAPTLAAADGTITGLGIAGCRAKRKAAPQA